MKKQGLVTGLNWRRTDPNHVQLPSWKVPLKKLQSAYAKNGLAEVFLNIDEIYGRNYKGKSFTAKNGKTSKIDSNKLCDCCCKLNR